MPQLRHHALETGGGGYISKASQLLMGVSSQIHAVHTLPPGKEPLIPTEWATKPDIECHYFFSSTYCVAVLAVSALLAVLIFALNALTVPFLTAVSQHSSLLSVLSCMRVSCLQSLSPAFLIW